MEKFIKYQKNLDQKDINIHELIYNLCDSILGQPNIGLFNGVAYIEKYKMINENHKFYKYSNFVKGNLVYDDKPFNNVLLKYDVFEDQLIVKSKLSPFESETLLNQDKINSFQIDDNDFINISIELKNGDLMEGFFEVLLSHKSVNIYKKI